MKLILLLISLLIGNTYQLCTSTPGVTTCKNEPLQRNLPIRIQNYQNLLEFTEGSHQIIPAGPFKLLPELRILILTNNKIETLEEGAFNGLYNLEKLSLYNNLLTNIPSGVFKDLRNLKSLNIGMNQISTISNRAFDGLIKLEEINLGFNKLTAIPTSLNTLPTLKTLTLTNNQIKKIPANSLHNLNRLEVLNLADNQISEIENKAFKGLVSVKDLKLYSNYLSQLNVQDVLEDMKALETVKLSVNSFKCGTLQQIDKKLKGKGVTLLRGFSKSANQYNGITCEV